MSRLIRKTDFSSKPLRAAGLLAVACVGSALTARCGDAPASPPWPAQNPSPQDLTQFSDISKTPCPFAANFEGLFWSNSTRSAAELQIGAEDEEQEDYSSTVGWLRLGLLPGFAPLGPVLDDPLGQSLLETDVISGLL